MAKAVAPAPANETSPPSNAGFMGKVIGAVIIAVIVLIQAGLVYFLLPNPDAIAARVRDEVKQELSEGGPVKEDVAAVAESADQTEVELGAFSLAIHQPSSNTTFNVTCRVMATIAKADQAEYIKLLANNSNRIRERIIIEFRSAEVPELTDPGLGLMKRRILEKTNQLLGKPLLKSIMFPDYNYYQQ